MATYRKTYLCICEGQQERMYFDHLAKLIKDFPKKVVKFKNDQLLLDDLNYVLRKTHKNWEAALKDNKPVNSVYYYKINFTTDVYDHD